VPRRKCSWANNGWPQRQSDDGRGMTPLSRLDRLDLPSAAGLRTETYRDGARARASTALGTLCPVDEAARSTSFRASPNAGHLGTQRSQADGRTPACGRGPGLGQTTDPTARGWRRLSARSGSPECAAGRGMARPRRRPGRQASRPSRPQREGELLGVDARSKPENSRLRRLRIRGCYSPVTLCLRADCVVTR
jgi:hypothetical protein